MMTTAELHRRNEAIALFEGWEKMTPEAACEVLKGDPLVDSVSFYMSDTGRIRQITNFTYDRSWDALMPVVEKMIVNGGKVTYEYFPLSEVHKVLVWARSSHYDADIITRHADMKQAYFLAVSDYCLSLQPHPGGPSGVEEY